MKKIFFTLLIALIPLYGISAPELKGTPQDLRGFLHPQDKIVTISGNAEEKAYSDQAIVSLVVTTQSKQLSEALSDNSVLRKEITSALLGTGVAPVAIKSSKFSSSPEYGWFGKKPSSYKVVNRMAITISEEKHLKDIAAVADSNDKIELTDTVFEHTKKDAYNQKVKEIALKKIIKQKEFYEQSLGVKLTTIGIRDSNVRHRATRGALVLEEVIVTSAKRESKGFASVAGYRDQTQTSSFDEVVYEANLSVDFKIER